MNIYILFLICLVLLRYKLNYTINKIIYTILFFSIVILIFIFPINVYIKIITLTISIVSSYYLFNNYLFLIILLILNLYIFFIAKNIVYGEKIVLITCPFLLAFGYLFYERENEVNRKYLHKLYKKGKLLGLLSKISISLQKADSVEEIMNIMLGALTEKYSLNFDRVVVFNYEKNKDFFYPYKIVEYTKENKEKLEEIKNCEIENSLDNIFGNVFYNEKAMLSIGLNYKDKFIHENFNPRVFALLPLIEQKSVLGIVYVESIKEDEIAYDDLDIAMTIVYQSAMAMNNAKLNNKNKIDARTDSLTKLYNKRYLDEKFDSLKFAWEEKKLPISILMIDIDYFKNYNDNNGHIMGNIALQNVANILVEQSRSRDLVIRFGGEEFAILLIEASLKEAKLIGERIRKKVEESSFENEMMQPNQKLTISLGVAEYEGEDLDAFIDKADIALYRSKKLGRNKLSVFRGDEDE